MELFHTDTDYSSLIFGVGPDRPSWSQPKHKLFGREITFEVFQPM